jgi:hypothetical protein
VLRRGNVTTVSWLPEKFAKSGKYVKLKGVDGWLVETVGCIRQSQEKTIERSRDYRHQRKSSDI